MLIRLRRRRRRKNDVIYSSPLVARSTCGRRLPDFRFSVCAYQRAAATEVPLKLRRLRPKHISAQ